MPDLFDPCAFEERAAIMEFCGGISRFEAENQAARAQGIARWQALQLCKETTDANGSRHSGGGRNTDATLAGQSRQDDMPHVQRQPEEENRPLPVDQQVAGRNSVLLPALRPQGRRVL